MPTSTPSFIPSVLPTIATTLPPTSVPSAQGVFSKIILTRGIFTQDPVILPITESELHELIQDIAISYGVNEIDIDLEIQYSNTGTVQLDPNTIENLDPFEFKDFIEDQIAELLNIHSSQVNVVFNTTSGEATYIILEDNIDDILDLVQNLNEPEFSTQLTVVISSEYSDLTIESIKTNYDLKELIDILVDIQNAISQDPEEAANEIEIKYSDKFDSEIDPVVVVTSMPSIAPTRTPSQAPVTLIPTVMPTITGRVLNIEMQKAVKQDYTMEEILEIETTIANIYGIDIIDVSVIINYFANGLLTFDGLSYLTDETLNELLDALNEFFTNELQIHDANIEFISKNKENEILFILSEDSTINLQKLIDVIKSNEFTNTLSNMIDNLLINIDYLSTDVSRIISNVNIKIDADDVFDENMEQFNQQVVDTYEDSYAYVNAQCKLYQNKFLLL